MRNIPARRVAGRIGLVLGVLGFGICSAAATSVVGTYDVIVGGMRVGVGGLKANVGGSAYTATATVRMTGLARLLADGRGSATSTGTLLGGKVVPTRYSISTSSGRYAQSVRMSMMGGTVRLLLVEPQPRPRPDLVPVTLSHRRGVVDPVGALVMPVPGTGDLLSPASCNRTLPVFDGRQRYDITLSFDRTETVQGQSPDSYAGPVIVCRARYHAVAGHRPDKDNIKQLEANRDLEVWLAPVQGTRVLVPWKIAAATPSGRVVISASKLTIADGNQLPADDPADGPPTEVAAKPVARP